MCLNVVLFLFAVLLFISPSNPQEPPALPQPEQQSANWLVLTWPPGYCLQSGCILEKIPKVPMFTIHGLWPVDSYGNILKNHPGNGNGIDRKQILQILRDGQFAQEMKIYWRSLCRNSNLNFWLHEWHKHGTQQRLVLPLYFYRTKDKAMFTLLLNRFSLGGIRPGRSYPHEKYMAALKRITNVHTGKPALLLCNQRDPRNVLSEVVVCLDKEAKNYVQCQEPPNYQPNDQGSCNYQGLCNQDEPISFLLPSLPGYH